MNKSNGLLQILNEMTLGKKLTSEALAHNGQINIQTINLKHLTAPQIFQALENSGLSDLPVVRARFLKSQKSPIYGNTFRYFVQDSEQSPIGEGAELFVYVNLRGEICAEFELED